MIYVKFYSKTKDCFLEDINRKPRAEIKKIISCEADIIYQSPHTNKIIWASKRLDENCVSIIAFDEAANKIASIKMEDALSDSDIAFTSLNEDNRIVVSFAAGQDGSQDYCIELNNNELKIIYKFPKNLSYMFSFDKYALLADFYSSVFLKFFPRILHRLLKRHMLCLKKIHYPMYRKSMIVSEYFVPLKGSAMYLIYPYLN